MLMPMHDWSRVTPGIYHNFHYRWIAAIMDRLNAGLLPKGLIATAEQVIGGPEPDVVTLQQNDPDFSSESNCGGMTILAEAPPQPKTQYVISADAERYAAKANRVVDLLYDNVNLLVIHPFPPNPRNPQGIHKAIWDVICEDSMVSVITTCGSSSTNCWPYLSHNTGSVTSGTRFLDANSNSS